MAQTYQMKHNAQGTIYSLLTVESDGRMTMTFHGTDREICHEVTENADGWLCYPGAMFPGLESGKWNKMDDVRGLTADVVETPRPRRQRKPRKPRVERETITINPEPLTMRSALPLCSAKNHDGRNLLSAVGMVAAATVALFVIYETGLLIPLGLIGLATGGILK